jgi:hypothetical protein
MMRHATLLVTFLIAMPVLAQLPALDEVRYCGEPKREADGSIARSREVLGAFKRVHPCPANGATSGACPGWAIDHVIPLACGGCDAVSNLQWLPNELKSKAVIGKDRFERRIYEKDIACSGRAIRGN